MYVRACVYESMQCTMCLYENVKSVYQGEKYHSVGTIKYILYLLYRVTEWEKNDSARHLLFYYSLPHHLASQVKATICSMFLLWLIILLDSCREIFSKSLVLIEQKCFYHYFFFKWAFIKLFYLYHLEFNCYRLGD